MPKVQFINEGFTAGEISQELQGRVSSDLYKESVHIMENMVPTVQGTAVRRPGTGFITTALHQNSATGHRLVPYRISGARGAMLHVGPDTIVVYDQNGVVTSSGAAVAIVNINSSFADQLNGWTERNYVVGVYSPEINNTPDGFGGGIIQIAPSASWDPLTSRLALKTSSNYPAYSVSWAGDPPFNITRTLAGLVQAIFLDPNTQYELKFEASTSTPNIVLPGIRPSGFVRVITVADPANLFPPPPRVDTADYATAVLATLPYNINTQTGTILFTTPNWGVPTKVHLEIRLEEQGYGAINQFGHSTAYGITSKMALCRVTRTASVSGNATFPSPWIGRDINLLSYAQTPEQPSRLILAHPDVATQQLVYNPVSDLWSLVPVAFVGAPWIVGDFPGVVGFHLGRMVMASSRARQERLWFSKTLDYFNFSPGTGLAADGFFGDLSEPGRILWLRPLWSLVIGAESGLWDISAVVGAVLGPGNSKAFKHQAHHSSNSAPALTNNEIAYVAEGGRRVYSVRREGDDNAYVDKELSFTARHMAVSGYRDIVWSEYPHNSLWVTTLDVGSGSVAGATYDTKLLAMAGWHRHNFGGVVQAMGSVNVGGIEQVYCLVTRIAGGPPFLALEKLDWSVHLDSFVRRSYAAPTTIIGSLGHFKGQAVYVVDASGNVHGPLTVADTSIILPDATVSAVVGISFRSKIVTNRPEGLSPSGTAQGLKKNWNKIFVRVAPGSRPLINGSRAPDRDPATPMNLGQGPAYEDIEVSNLGWTKDGTITIEEFLPVPLNVAAVFGHVTAEIL